MEREGMAMGDARMPGIVGDGRWRCRRVIGEEKRCYLWLWLAVPGRRGGRGGETESSGRVAGVWMAEGEGNGRAGLGFEWRRAGI
ncbi:unnamed protein product [Linum trigynum]|uniref:Uncharacterized protein n=1 Tax=Linum trigynum TaxID=586398 RepID=A0AAV2GSH9_9ROSI